LLEKTYNALVTLVVLKEKCFQEPFKAIKTVRISKFIMIQQLPDCRTSVEECTTAVRAELTARHSEMVQTGRL